jgi:hypothetical protein
MGSTAAATVSVFIKQSGKACFITTIFKPSRLKCHVSFSFFVHYTSYEESPYVIS